MKRGYGLACLGAAAIAAALVSCGGEGDESIGGVIPGEVFVGRSVEVLIVGSNTEWTDNETVSLGEGVTVVDVTAASPTALLVQATIEPDAVLGARDVAVGELTYASGFEVISPIEVTVQGTVAQGSISMLRIQNRDFANPFDTTSLQPGRFEHIQIAVGEGIFLDLSSVAPYALEMIVLVDVDAPSGMRDINVLSGPPGQARSFLLPDAFGLSEREAIPLVTGQPAAGMITRPFDSALYSVSPEQLSIVSTWVTAESPNAAPNMVLLPSSGSFGDLIPTMGRTTFVTDDLHYVVYWDNGGGTNYTFNVGGDANAIITAVAEAEPNNSRAQAIALDGTPGVVETSSLPEEDDVDWVRLDLTAETLGDGKVIHALTYGEDELTDTVLTLFRGSNQLAESPDSNFQEELFSSPITEPGTYYLRVTASEAGFYDPEHSAYGLAILLEDP